MNRLFAIAPAALAALSLASVANAGAVAGTYTGTSADGNYVSFTVSVDGNSVLALTSQSYNFSAMCNDGSTLNTGWGLGYDTPITGSTVKNTFAFADLTNVVKLTFSGDGQSATGTIRSIGPSLTPIGPKPHKALFCKSPTQSLSVTLQPGAARVKPPAQGAVYLGKTVTSAN